MSKAVPPGWGGWDQINWPLEDQWTHHAVADTILANSLLRSLPGVDSERIGITGISWGGYLTCIVAGMDPRFKLAAPVYGCGFYLDTVFSGDLSKLTSEQRDRWIRWWEPLSNRLFLPWMDVTGIIVRCDISGDESLVNNTLGISGHDFVDNQVRLHLFVLAYNLGNFLRQAVLTQAVHHWTLTTLREKLIKIGAKVVRHSRKIVFQMTEVAVRESCSGLFPGNWGTSSV